LRLINYIKEQSEYKIYCDLDGVLVDFIRGIRDKIDPTVDDWGEWKLKKQKTNDHIWDEIKKLSPKYWSDLHWTKDGKQLWTYIKKYDPIILTARPKLVKEAIKGKQDWINKHLGSKFLKTALIVLGIQKQDHAKKGSILIDDNKRNIRQWESKGGIGVLHKNTSDTIKQLKELGT